MFLFLAYSDTIIAAATKLGFDSAAVVTADNAINF